MYWIAVGLVDGWMDRLTRVILYGMLEYRVPVGLCLAVGGWSDLRRRR